MLPSLSLCRTRDVQLLVGATAMEQLHALRKEEKFQDLPGVPAEAERKQFTPLLNGLLDEIIGGIQENPRLDWVLEKMEPFVARFYLEDTELRESCITYLERIFAILGIPNDDGAFVKYMIIW